MRERQRMVKGSRPSSSGNSGATSLCCDQKQTIIRQTNEESALHTDNQTNANKKREFIKEQGVACVCCRQVRVGRLQGGQN